MTTTDPKPPRKKSPGFLVDLTGNVYHYLTVIARSPQKPKVHWTCLCICGATVSVRANRLVSGNAKSCGCRTGEFVRLAHCGILSPAKAAGIQRRTDRYREQFPEGQKKPRIRSLVEAVAGSRTMGEIAATVPTVDEKARTQLKTILDARRIHTNWRDTAELAGCTVEDAKRIHAAFYGEDAA